MKQFKGNGFKFMLEMSFNQPKQFSVNICLNKNWEISLQYVMCAPVNINDLCKFKLQVSVRIRLVTCNFPETRNTALLPRVIKGKEPLSFKSLMLPCNISTVINSWMNRAACLSVKVLSPMQNSEILSSPFFNNLLTFSSPWRSIVKSSMWCVDKTPWLPAGISQLQLHHQKHSSLV